MKVDTTINLLVMVLMAARAYGITCSSLFGNETDMLSLLEFKNAISADPQQALMSWNESTHICNWEGVRCRMKNPHRVTSLDLEHQGLVGQISPSLANLTFLKTLILLDNSFTDPPFPCNNTLQGGIPSFSNCSSLKVLLLNGNHLAGQIPIGWPSKLEDMNLSANNLTGILPASLANLTMLNDFRCLFNNIKGVIPNEFAKFRRLHIFYVGINRLSGRFPQAMLNLSTLVDLSLTQNSFTGEVPSDIGNYLPKLQRLFLASNFFQWHIPPSLVNASKLSQIDISRNNFTGVMPDSIGKLSKLYWLNLELNKLEAHENQDWEFMHSLASCSHLRVFSLNGNVFKGHVPSSLGNLSVKLETLNLGANKLSWSFPFGIENFLNLIHLTLGINQLTGVVPGWIGSLKKLQSIDLSDNNFTGFIPTSLSNLSLLGNLYLSHNNSDGPIPPSLGILQMLQAFYASNNNLHGRIPKEIFIIQTIIAIDLSFNNLDRVPVDFGNARQLLYLSLSSNKLSGDIPNTLGNVESLQYIMLDSNIFSGSIPTSLVNIRGLKFLNFYNNNLSGSIPMSLGNLQLLEQLDLSFNHLEGEVPTNGIFKNVTAMWLGENQGLCGGILELQLQACSIMHSNSTKHKLFVVLKVVIPMVFMVSLAMVILILLSRGKKKTKSMILPSFHREFPKVSFLDIVRATKGFSPSNIIGRGRYGCVYEGKLFQDGNFVAIKVFNMETRGSTKSFITECNALRGARHRNLVSIVTACSSIDSSGNDVKALVYKLMPRGDLHRVLYSTQDYKESSGLIHMIVPQRLSIVVDVTDALEYLHHNNQGTIVHCDMKPKNILLDENMTAHVGDFGLARFKVDSAVSPSDDLYLTSSVAINGTIGYIAPECATGGHVSIASDVYSFGIVILEIFLRKSPTDGMYRDGLDIAKFVEMNFPGRISQIVEPELLQDQPEFPKQTPVVTKRNNLDCLISVLSIGLCCTKLSQNERPNMQEVAASLHGIKES
ncbi:hypothetical protein BRADI_4g24436v3 [Brachypodium distachyon]|uniref:Receptor kinase-like protein Xa21 n=1 Tax=Brachypodium distachyon TaxID=15368 RepID=A0A2K2CPZ4_BRADI|nr:hypothetical protein BRADI_4g24436v3 [Brachypodium distachyon]